MEYLELDQLELGKKYVCIPYWNSNEKLILRYIGDGSFESYESEVLSVYGDVRYVLPLESK